MLSVTSLRRLPGAGATGRVASLVWVLRHPSVLMLALAGLLLVTPVQAAALISLSQTASVSPVGPGGLITYAINATNIGNAGSGSFNVTATIGYPGRPIVARAVRERF